MQVSFSIFAILYIVGAAQGAFLALALFSQRGTNTQANRYLGLLTLVFVAALLDFAFDTMNFGERYVWVQTLLWPKEFLFGVLIYFYVRELTLPGQYPLAGWQWLHFVPFFLHLLASWSLLLLDGSRQYRILSDQAIEMGYDTFMALLLGDVELLLSILHIGLYLLLALRLIRVHNLRIRQAFSDIEKINLCWLSRLLTGICLVYLIWLVEELVSPSLQQEGIWGALLGGSMVVLIYSMGYLGLRQPLIFSRSDTGADGATTAMEAVLKMPLDTEEQHESSEQKVQKKYKNSPVSKELGESLFQELEAYMAQHQPFLDREISLPRLAEQLDMPLNYLSQVINEQAGRNFFDFINSYRIVAAKALLVGRSDSKLTILDLAMAVGFNSKSAFYNAFKKHTGMTPTQYRAQQQDESGLKPTVPE